MSNCKSYKAAYCRGAGAAVKSITDCHYCDFIFPGNLFASFLFEQKGFSGFEGEDGNPSARAGFESLGSKARNIEAQIVIFTGDFHRDRATTLSGELAATGEAFVCSFK